MERPPKFDVTNINIYIGQFTRATPKFKSQRSVYRKTPPDKFAAAKSFRTLKVEESIEAYRRNIMPGNG